MLKNVRISYPKLFVAEQFQGTGTFSYSAAFHIVPGSDNDKKIRAAIAIAAKRFEKKEAEIIASITGNPNKYCYMNGAIKGLENLWILSAKRKQTDGKPDVMDKNPTVKLTANDARIYGGCYVNAKVEPWAQVKGTGSPGIRCTLIAVQFANDGESFGGAPPVNDDGFESVEEDDDPTA
jgi:hypothetical protein